MYIYDNVVILSSKWYVLRFEHAHGLRRYNAASLGLLLPYFILTIFIAVFPKTIAPSMDF